jgi:hypothetical protein
MQLSRCSHAQVAWQHGGPQAACPVRPRPAPKRQHRAVQVGYASVPAAVIEKPADNFLQPLPPMENVADDPS